MDLRACLAEGMRKISFRAGNPRVRDMQESWTTIPARISGVSLPIKPGGCKDNICTLQVGSSVPGDPISTEAINCKTSQIRTITTAGNPGPWLRIDSHGS